MSHPLVLILAGGTGGHVYPALAVADKLRKQGCAILWLGQADKIEAKVAQEAGIEFYALRGTGVRGKHIFHQLLGVLRIARDSLRLYFWLARSKPAVAVGFGGYSSVAAGCACWLRRVPLVIQEQNARAGTSNKLLATFASSICLGYADAMTRGQRIVVTGNPVREAFLSVSPSKSKGPLRILVLGGSLGARSINQAVAGAAAKVDMPYGLRLVHQCGANHYESTQALYDQAKAQQDSGVEIQLQAFLDPVMDYYTDCDLVICRAGAMTLAEIAICGLPALLIPYPHAIDDHQSANANAHLSTGGGWLLADKDCKVEAIAQWLHAWLQQEPQEARKKMMELSQRLQTIAQPNAAQNVVDIVMERLAS